MVFVVMALAPSPALAGRWMQVSCVNPNGTAAPNDGWSGFSSGNPGGFSSNDNQCGPGTPMSAILSQFNPVPVGANEFLQYQPPSGSRLVGGTVDVDLDADGYGTDSGNPPKINAVAIAALYEPGLVFNSPSNLFFQCVAWLVACSKNTSDTLGFSGPISLPASRGGNLYLQAGCAAGDPNGACNTNARNGAWALAEVNWAHLLLVSNVAPEGTDFSGSALQRGARGMTHLVFTASDPGGPGVHAVTAKLGSKVVWSGVPNDNAGACVAVGTDPASGALMFDAPQPCLSTEVVDIPVPTRGFPDGAHELAVTVTDAAQNVSPVLDQTITTSNPQTTPVPRSRRAVHARFVISWSWAGRHTSLRSIKVQKLTRNAHVAVRCLGRGCPRLKVKS
ncbi:MAG TPA: hypothetical protein VGL51_16330, partial [Solirubrobacteraceae bacterium]